MKPIRVVVGVSFIVLTLLGSFIAMGAADAPSGSNPELLTFYSGGLGHVGRFRGKLLCLCCDLMPDKEKAKSCDRNNHQAVLSVAEDGSLHPLIAGTAEVTKQINSDALHGKQVVVSGKYYPSTGLIFVGSIEVQ